MNRRDNLHTVYMYVVRNWAVDINDMATGFAHLDADSAAKVKELDKKAIQSLLTSLERKGLVVGEKVNGEGTKVWQSYHDVENEDGAVESAEGDFNAAFPGEVADTTTPAQVDRSRPNEGQVIYEVKRTRLTGAHVTLTNYSTGEGKRRYVATCKTHGTEHAFDKRLAGEAQCHHPEVWCADCQVIDTTNQHEQVQQDLAPRYIVTEVSVGDAGLTARPAVYDTQESLTVHIYKGKNGKTNAEKRAAKMNKENR